MKSVLLKRILMLIAVATLLFSAITIAGYYFVSKANGTRSEIRDLKRNAEVIGQLIVELKDGDISWEGYKNLEAKGVFEDSTDVVLFGSMDKIEIMHTGWVGFSDDDLTRIRGENYLSRIANGETVEDDDISLSSGERSVLVGIPVYADGQYLGALIVVKPFASIAGSLAPMNTPLLWLSLSAAVILLLVSSWRASRIADPLHRMADKATEMANGNLSVRIPGSDEPGEVGLLARSINYLSDRLAKTIYQLRNEKGQLNQILYSLSDGVAATDGLGMLTHYNPALMQMFGAVSVLKREDLVSDRAIWDAFDRVYASGKQETLTYKMQNERALWITISAVVTEDGECTGVVGLFKDVTEMERTENMRREYVANVSHELRTPITAVRGLLEPLADGMVQDEETRRRYYKIMLHETERLSRLLTDMMTLSRLQSGTEYMEMSRVDIMELVHDVAQSYAKVAGEKGIELVVDADCSEDALTDPDRVEQVLVILIDNAMRYTPEGGVITLKLRNSKKILLSVEDTGCGIPEKDMEHIFERFYKVDKSRHEGGTGLGLSIAKQIMDKLGESITVRSRLGVGTTFELTLKRYSPNAIRLGPVNDDKAAFVGEDARGVGMNGAPLTSDSETEGGDSTGKVADAEFEVIEE